MQAVDQLKQLCDARGLSITPVAVAWVLAQPGITSAIVGASKPEQLDATLAAINLTLDQDEKDACNQAWYHLPRPMVPPR